MAIRSRTNNVVVSFGQIAQQAATEAERLSGLLARADAEGFGVVAVYNTQRDDRVRPSHRVREGLQWDIDDPDMLVPPTDPGCRCYLTFHAKTERGSQAMGIPEAPRPVETPEQGLERFGRVARRADTNERLTDAELYGPTRARLLEQGKVTVGDMIDPETDDLLPVTVLQSVAAAGSRRVAGRAIASTAQLSALGVSTADLRTIRTLAANAITQEGKSVRAAVSQAVAEVYPTQPAAWTRRVNALALRAVGPYLEDL